ncbi:MAG TPA: hypothetical protein VGK50_05030 [Coriobacteriia bacterium]|jgi:hypothetical protein
MGLERSDTLRERFELAGDGALITAAMFSAFTSIALLLSAPFEQSEVPVAVQLMSAVAVFVPGVAGPVVAWLMHGRRISLVAVLGAMAGVPVAGVVLLAFALLTFVLGWIVSPISRADYAGPLAGVGLLTIGFFVLVGRLVIAAVRDLASKGPSRRALAIARVLSAVVVTAFSAAIVFLAFPRRG